MKTWSFLCVLFSCILLCYSQTCTNKTELPESCQTLFEPYDSVLYAVPGGNMTITIAGMQAQFQGLTAAPVSCQQAGVEFICAAPFVDCAAPAPVCQDKCTAFVEICGPVFAASGVNLSALTDCSLFPTDSCADLNYTGKYPIRDCPGELVAGDAGSCGPRCPSPYFSEEQTAALDIFASVGGYLSFCCCLLVLLTYALRWKDEKDTMVFWFVFSFTGVAFDAVWGTIYGWQRMRCEDDITPKEYEADGVIFGVILQFFGLSATLWWFFVALNIAIILVTKRVNDPYRFKIMHVFVWTYSAIIVIIALSVEKMGCTPGATLCTLQQDERGNTTAAPRFWWSLGLNWIHITIYSFGAICLLVFVVIWLIKRLGLAGLKQYWRIATFVFVMFLTYLFPQIAFYDGVTNTQKYYDNIVEWVECQLSAPDPDQCELGTGPSYGLQFLSNMAIFFVGVVCFLLFGLTGPNFKFWKMQLYKALGKPYNDTKQDTKSRRSDKHSEQSIEHSESGSE